MRLSAVMMGLSFPFFVLFLTLPRKEAALLSLVPLSLVFSFFTAPTFALMQRLVPDQMRATTLAITLLLANLIGMGIGPQVVGVLSDLFRSQAGDDSLRYAMLIMSSVTLCAAYHMWQVGKAAKVDLAGVGHSGELEIAEPRKRTNV